MNRNNGTKTDKAKRLDSAMGDIRQFHCLTSAYQVKPEINWKVPGP